VAVIGFGGNGHTRIVWNFPACASGYGPTMGAMCKLDHAPVRQHHVAGNAHAARTGVSELGSHSHRAAGSASPSAACRKRALAQDAKCAGALMTGLRTVNGHVLPAARCGVWLKPRFAGHTISGRCVTVDLAEARCRETLSSRIIGPLTPVYPGSTVSLQHSCVDNGCASLRWRGRQQEPQVLLAGQTQ
jgi:hypothetical protein